MILKNKRNMINHKKMLYHTRWVILFLLTLFVGLEDLQAENSSDEIFGGQILTMTEEKPPLAPSNDPRFKDNNDGTAVSYTHLTLPTKA